MLHSCRQAQLPDLSRGCRALNHSKVAVFTDARQAKYNFGESHPFGPRRFFSFYQQFIQSDFAEEVQRAESRLASQEELEWFHTHEYIEHIKAASVAGDLYLDGGDTPAFRGMYEAAGRIVGTVLLAIEQIQSGACRRAFVPIAGMHHGRRDRASGFCVFNDCCVAIEMLRRVFGIRRVAYVDIDAHHGDGVFYSYEADPDLTIVDFHEDGRFLYPGTGSSRETGRGAAAGTKLNVPLPPGADDDHFHVLWPAAEEFLDQASPEFILLQCGADSMKGDPLTHLRYSQKTHGYVSERLSHLADKHCDGKLLTMGGGGYSLANITTAWNAVIEKMITA